MRKTDDQEAGQKPPPQEPDQPSPDTERKLCSYGWSRVGCGIVAVIVLGGGIWAFAAVETCSPSDLTEDGVCCVDSTDQAPSEDKDSDCRVGTSRDRSLEATGISEKRQFQVVAFLPTFLGLAAAAVWLHRPASRRILINEVAAPLLVGAPMLGLLALATSEFLDALFQTALALVSVYVVIGAARAGLNSKEDAQ